MLNLSGAESLIATAIAPLQPKTKPVHDCLGQVLATSARSQLTQPQWPQVAMDGYALALNDGNNGPWPLQGPVAAAGDPTATLESGHALRVTTGSPLPNGANTVVIQENTEIQGTSLHLTEPAKLGANIRPAGQDFMQGEVVVRPGQRITAGAIATLHHAGVTEIEVYPLPRLGIIITGSELLRDGAPLTDGKTPDTNGPYLKAWAAQRNLSNELHVCDESPEALTALVSTLRRRVDVLVVCGGASVGPRDGSHAGLLDAGAECVFSKVAQKPGKPMALYRFGEQPALLLPGNPAAVFCAAEWHLQNLIQALQGLYAAPMTDLVIDGPCPQVGGRALLARAQAYWGTDGRLHAAILEGQLSHLLGNLPGCNALVRLDPGRKLKPGDSAPGKLLYGAEVLSHPYN